MRPWPSAPPSAVTPSIQKSPLIHLSWPRGSGRQISGNTQIVKSLSIDCDGDAVLLRVEQAGGAACHTGRRSCFFRRLADGDWVDEGVQVFDPGEVYGR